MDKHIHTGACAGTGTGASAGISTDTGKCIGMRADTCVPLEVCFYSQIWCSLKSHGSKHLQDVPTGE